MSKNINQNAIQLSLFELIYADTPTTQIPLTTTTGNQRLNTKHVLTSIKCVRGIKSYM